MHRNRDRRAGNGGRKQNGGGAGQKVGLGNVHPAPPASVHNPIRLIEPHERRADRQKDYNNRHGYSIG